MDERRRLECWVGLFGRMGLELKINMDHPWFSFKMKVELLLDGRLTSRTVAASAGGSLFFVADNIGFFNDAGDVVRWLCGFSGKTVSGSGEKKEIPVFSSMEELKMKLDLTQSAESPQESPLEAFP